MSRLKELEDKLKEKGEEVPYILKKYYMEDDLRNGVNSGLIPVVFGGHNKNHQVSSVDHLRFDRILPDETIQALHSAVNGGSALETPVKVYFGVGARCRECGEEPQMQTDGKSIVCVNPCKYPEGHPAFVFELNVPSGKMVVGNDFRDLFPVVGDYDIGNHAGSCKTSERYAQSGLAHAYVGNSCPGVWQVGKNKKKFLIGNGRYDEAKDETLPIARNAERVAGICTDLWWYSIADHDEFVKRGGDPKDEDVVECVPGVYRFTHVHHLLNDDSFGKSKELYTTVQWVRKPDPIKDYKAEYDSLNLTAGQVLLNKIKKWPTLYQEKMNFEDFSFSKLNMEDSLACAAGHLVSSCRDYHPNGWLGGEPELTSDAEDMEVPVFDKQYHWMELSEYDPIMQFAGLGKNFGGEKLPPMELNESFTKLIFNVLRCHAKYGTTGYGKSIDPDGSRAVNSQKNARKAFLALCKRIPDRVPDFCKEYLKELKGKKNV